MSSLSILPDWSIPRPLRLAVAASIALHGLALVARFGVPALQQDAPPLPLNVILRSALPDPAPAPVPAARPLPVEAPAPPPATHMAEPVSKPLPQRPAVMTRPVNAERAAPALARSETPAPAPEQAVSAPVTPAPVVSASAPARPAPVAEAAPVVALAVHPALDEAPDPALLERYGRSLSSLFARQQQYPRLAALRGWEGEVQVRVTIARRGNIVATQIVRSSGFEVLDQNAIQLVASSGPLPRPPEALQNKELQIIVPVLFKLEKPT